MARRSRGGLIDAAEPGGGEAIEILDLDAPFDDGGSEVLELNGGDSPSRARGLAAVVLGGLAMLGVVTTGNTPAPEPPAPSVIIPPTPADIAEQERAAEIAELEAIYGVRIGDGPGLIWDPVVWNIDTTEFRWIDDGFVGQNGDTEWTIEPRTLGPSISQRQSLEIAYAGYSMVLVDGARLMVPQLSTEDHLIALVGERDPVRFELPPLAFAPTTDLVTVDRAWFGGVVVDEQIVVAGYQAVSVDRDVLGARTGRDVSAIDWFEVSGDRLRLRSPGGGYDDPILFDDVGFTDDEIADFQLIEQYQAVVLSLNLLSAGVEAAPLELSDFNGPIVKAPAGVGLTWTDEDGQGWLSTSDDGSIWSTGPFEQNGFLSFSDATLYSFPFGGSSDLERSTDLGRTWQSTRRPLGWSFNNAAIDDTLFVAETQSIEVGDPFSIAVNDYNVTVDDLGRSYEVIETATGEVIASRQVEPRGGFSRAFSVYAEGITVNDPDSGEKLLTITQGALLQAYSDAIGLAPPEVAMTRWDRSDDDPKWLIQPVAELFDDAVRVNFVPGDEYVLAIVTTTRGYDYYVARTAASP